MPRPRPPAAALLAASVAFGFFTAHLSASEDEHPVIQTLEVSGATVYDREAVLRFIRLKPGSLLTRDVREVASGLQARYRIAGYPAAEVTGSFDPATGTLRLHVDEGRLASVRVLGLGEGSEELVRDVMALPLGAPLRDEQVADGLRRLQDVSSGAYETVGDPPYSLERAGEGVRLTLHLRRRTMRIDLRPRGGTGRASLYNRVDGYSPGFRAELALFDPRSFNPLDLYLHGSYGFAAEAFRFALGGRKAFGRERMLVLGYEFHDLTDTDDTFRGWGLEKPKGRTVFFNVFEDYHGRRGHEAYAFARPSPALHLGVTFRSDIYRTLPVEADRSFPFHHDPPDNPPVAEGLMRSIVLSARWTSGQALFPDWDQEREAFLMRNLYGTAFDRTQGARAEATIEVADVDGLGGIFTFTRFIGHLRGARALSPRQTVMARGLLGLSSGQLPSQRRFALGGLGTLRGRSLRERTGNAMSLVTLEYAFEPGSPAPALILFYDGGKTWKAAPPSPWLNDVGVGLAWPGSGFPIVRVDVGVPLNAVEGGRDARVTGLLRIPF